MGVLGVERDRGGSVRSLEKALIHRVRPYENRTPRHSGESRNPFAGAGGHTAGFHSPLMRENRGERQKT